MFGKKIQSMKKRVNFERVYNIFINFLKIVKGVVLFLEDHSII